MTDMSSTDPPVNPSPRRVRFHRSSGSSGHSRERAADPHGHSGLNPEVTGAWLTGVIGVIKAGWSETSDAPADLAARAPILAAVALAVDRGDASCIDAPARPSLRLTMHLVDLLQDELLTLWRSGECSPGYVLPTVDRLRRVRTDLESRLQQLPGAPLAGYDGFDFLIEFVHDMRSPLSSLQMLADRLHRGWSGPLNELQLRQLRLMYAATHALNTVTMNALQLTRACTQLEEPEARPFSVMRLLSEVEDIVGALAIQRVGDQLHPAQDGPSPRSSDRAAAHPSQPRDECAEVHSRRKRDGECYGPGTGSPGVRGPGYGATYSPGRPRHTVPALPSQRREQTCNLLGDGSWTRHHATARASPRWSAAV